MSFLTDDDLIDEGKIANAAEGLPLYTPRRRKYTQPQPITSQKDRNSTMITSLLVGIDRKQGRPGYSSDGASCHFEVTVTEDEQRRPAELKARIRSLYDLCCESVQEALDRSHPDTAIDAEDARPSIPEPAARRWDPATLPPVPGPIRPPAHGTLPSGGCPPPPPPPPSSPPPPSGGGGHPAQGAPARVFGQGGRAYGPPKTPRSFMGWLKNPDTPAEMTERAAALAREWKRPWSYNSWSDQDIQYLHSVLTAPAVEAKAWNGNASGQHGAY
jgi:hypothetical protein